MARTAVVQKQNLLKYSEVPDNAAWTTTSATWTANSIANPVNGALTAYEMTEANATAAHRFYSGIAYVSVTIGQTLTASVYVKAGTRNWVVLTQNDGIFAYFNLTTGLNGTVTSGTLTSKALADGWYRLQWTFQATTAAPNISFGLTSADNTSSGVGDGTGTMYFWGMQLVRANWAGQYVATTSAAVDTGNLRNISTSRTALPTKQNLTTRSKDAANVAWTKLGLNATTPIVSNDAVAPDGTTTADRIVEDASSGLHILYRNTGATLAPGMYTISASLKQGTRRYGGLQIIVGSALQRYFVLLDLQTGTVVSTNTTGTITDTNYTVVSQGNGWYRLSVTARQQDLGAVNICVSPSDSASPAYSASFPSYAGDNASGIYATDYQVVNANWPGPFVATTTTVVNTGNLRNSVPQKQNLFIDSQELNLNCSTVGASITTDTTDTLDPWGTNTAEVLVEDGSTGTHRIQNLGGVISAVGLVQTLSIYVKAGARSVAYVQNSVSESVTVDLSNGNITASVGGISRGTQNAGNGWWRIWITFVSAGANASLYVYAYNGGFSYTGVNGTKALYVTGGQYVNANWPGVYTRTGTTVINPGYLRNVVA